MTEGGFRPFWRSVAWKLAAGPDNLCCQSILLPDKKSPWYLVGSKIEFLPRGYCPPVISALLTDAHEHRPIVCHHGHAHLYHRALKTFVAQFARPTCEQRCNVTFHHRTAITTGTSQMDLTRGPNAIETKTDTLIRVLN
jgi:hypothetical protein